MAERKISNEPTRVVKALTGTAVIENAALQNPHSRLIVNLNGEPATVDEALHHKPNIRATNGSYFIKYYGRNNPKRDDRFPFVVGTDLLGFRLKVSGPEHFESLASKIPEIKWMMANTNYSKDLFLIAKIHTGILIPFSVNWTPLFWKCYGRLIHEGKDPTVYKPFVSIMAYSSCDLPMVKNDRDLCAPEKTIRRNKKKVEELSNSEEYIKYDV